MRLRRHNLTRLGYPVLPDTLTTASGQPWSFSPQTPDSIMIDALTQAGQSLPPDLAAIWAASQSGTQPVQSTSPAPPSPLPAVTPSGEAVSTQTGSSVTLVSTLSIAPGVFQCMMSDGSKHYCDSAGTPISYTPPATAPAVTPASSLPTSAVSPTVTPTPQDTLVPRTPVAVSPSGTMISTTSGSLQPEPAPVPANSMMEWLKGSMFGGIPNWVLVAGASLFLFSGHSNSRKR